MGTRERKRGGRKKSKIERTITEWKKEEKLKFRIESRIACECTHAYNQREVYSHCPRGRCSRTRINFSSSRRYQWFPLHGSRSRWSLRSRSRIIKLLHNTSFKLLSRLFSANSVLRWPIQTIQLGKFIKGLIQRFFCYFSLDFLFFFFLIFRVFKYEVVL